MSFDSLAGLVTFIGACSQANSASKAEKEARIVPMLIFEVEKFEALVVTLSSKWKQDLLRFMKRSTSRDFRIQPNEVSKAIEKKEKEASKENKRKGKVSSLSNKQPKKGKQAMQETNDVMEENECLEEMGDDEHLGEVEDVDDEYPRHAFSRNPLRHVRVETGLLVVDG